MIPFNKPYITGKEMEYMSQAVISCHLSGNGIFTGKCQKFFEERYGIRKCLLTTSGTDALEMCALLCRLGPGDEVIVPSYTFVSTALAFVREGASVIFADSTDSNPNLDADKLESLVTPRTRVIVVVHYAGVASDMDIVMDVARRHNLIVVEDAAHAIDSCYKGRPLGSIGHLGAFSFHETKNITSGGEGGLLVINDERFSARAEIIWEKGTNRTSFSRGEVNKYGWVDVGSSFLPAEINAAFLYAQLESLDEIQCKRKALWERYYDGLCPLSGRIGLPVIPDFATNNGHIFYLVCRNQQERTGLIDYLKEHHISAHSHYLSLHKSRYYLHNNPERTELPKADMYSDCLVRLPLYYELEYNQVDRIVREVRCFYESY